MSTSWSTDVGEVVVGVVGVTGSGKSTLIKRITECNEIVPGDGVESVTQEIGQYRFQHQGVQYVLVDTPGFDDSGRDDEDIFLQLAKWTEKSFRAGQRMNGLPYLHPIISNRERGSEMRNLRMFKKICGPDNYKNVVLGLTFCDAVEAQVIAERQQQLENTPHWWGDMISRGSRVERIPFERDGCIQVLSSFAPHGKLTLNIQAEVVERGVALDDTEAAHTIAHKQELEAIRARERVELANMRQEFEKRMRKAREDFNNRLLLEQQRFESIRKRQQIQEQTFRMQQQLQEELDRKDKLLQAERQAEEDERAKELARLEEQIRKVRLENAQIEERRKIQIELARAWPSIKARAQRGSDDWAAVQDWRKPALSDSPTLSTVLQMEQTWTRKCITSYIRSAIVV